MKKLTILSVLIFLLVGCDNIQDFQLAQKVSSNGMEIIRINCSPDYSRFTVDIKMDEGLKPCLLTDSSLVKIRTTEWMNEFEKCSQATQPHLIDVTNLKIRELTKLHLRGLVLVDLTLPEEIIKEELAAVKELKAMFSNKLYVAFIGKGVSESLPVTDYVLKDYFKPQEASKNLYRSILCKLDEMNGHPSRYYPDMQQDTAVWHGIPLKQKVLIILSDGRAYNGDAPVDPGHYGLKQELVQSGDSTVNPAIYYVNYQSSVDTDTDADIVLEDITESHPILQLLCRKTSGIYFEKPDWTILTDDLLHDANIPDIDYQFTYLNPDFKVYRGQKRFLRIECFANDSLYASTVYPCTLGSLYNPLVVHGLPTTLVILQGTLLSGLLILSLYGIMQFIIPFVRYQRFRKKYVVHYTSQNMSVGDRMVGQSCYYCKAPLKEGDEIVVKCKHVLHKSCWDENEYKCPEYGRKCKHGTHYYNRFNLFDEHNATFYLPWVVYSLLAGFLAWFLFTLRVHYHDLTVPYLIIQIYDLSLDDPGAIEAIGRHGSRLFFLPFFGFAISLFLAFFLSLLASHGHWLRCLWQSSLKALFAGLGGYLAFTLGCVISLLLDLDDNSFLIDWIPWCLTEFIIAFIVAYGTDIKLKRALKGAACAIVFGLGSMYFWSFTYEHGLDSRLLCLFSYLIYAVGLSVSLAITAPKSEHYFLRVEGPVKEMELALYKWMNVPQKTKKVTIGKSVDCDLQVSWDLESDIAPVQAEIKMIKGGLYVIAIADGIRFMGKPLSINVRERLYHGDSFKIGCTVFTYIEKDI